MLSSMCATSLAALLVLFSFVDAVAISSSTSASVATGSVCSQPAYLKYLPLSSYAPAESYCSSIYAPATPVVTSTTTLTRINKVTLTTTLTTDPVTRTAFAYSIGVTTTTITVTPPVYTASIPYYVAAPIAPTDNASSAFIKRAATTPLPALYAAMTNSSNRAFRTSACSCILPATTPSPLTKTIRVTSTLNTTLWRTVVAKPTTTLTLATTSTRTKTLTSTATGSTSTVYTATSTVSQIPQPTPQDDTCGTAHIITHNSDPPTWSVYYAGTNVTDAAAAGANPWGYATVTSAIETTLDDFCGAVHQCAKRASGDAPWSGSWDLHFLQSTQGWVCVLYHPAEDVGPDAAWFSVVDEDVIAAYGYFVDWPWR